MVGNAFPATEKESGSLLLSELYAAAPGSGNILNNPIYHKEHTMDPRIEKFLSSQAFGVAGASTNREKYGNKVLRCYLANGKKAIPINPRADKIEGVPCVAGVADLPPDVKSLSVITPPKITEAVVDEAIGKGIENVWMQPGAESPAAVEKCRKAGINVIADGSCLLVVLGYREH
jgi:predicted CoA-binding protein